VVSRLVVVMLVSGQLRCVLVAMRVLRDLAQKSFKVVINKINMPVIHP
jgi:hypothetical protein